MFSTVLQISSSWECIRRYAWYAAPLQASCQLNHGAQHRRRSQNAITMAWDTQTTKLGSEERFRRILPLCWHSKNLNSIYSEVSAGWKKGLQHSPQGLVLLFSLFQEGGLQSLGCGSLANLILSRSLCCRHAIYCQAGSKSVQTWGVKWGHIVPLPVYLNIFPFIYTDTLRECVIMKGLGGNTENKCIWG